MKVNQEKVRKIRIFGFISSKIIASVDFKWDFVENQLSFSPIQLEIVCDLLLDVLIFVP